MSEKTYGMCIEETPSEAGDVHKEKTGCYMVEDEDQTTPMFLQNATGEKTIVEEEGANVCKLFTPFPKNTHGHFIHVARELPCSRRSDTLDQHTRFILCNRAMPKMHSRQYTKH